MIKKVFKKASFTLVEMVFVIVILGILSGFISEIIVHLYRNYIIQNQSLRMELILQNTVDKISNYIESSIRPSLALRNGTNITSMDDVQTMVDGNITNDTAATASNRALMWIGKDVESLQGVWVGDRRLPTYSGVVDLNASSGTLVATRNITNDNADRISQTQAIVERLIGGRNAAVPTDANINSRYALYFPYANSDDTTANRFWDVNSTSIFPITSFANAVVGRNQNITLARQPAQMGEKFYLAYSAYGITYDLSADGQDGNLSLTWNFRPWNGDTLATFEANTNNNFLLLEEVTRFSVWTESGGSILRMYLCIGDRRLRRAIGSNNYQYCKESVVVR